MLWKVGQLNFVSASLLLRNNDWFSHILTSLHRFRLKLNIASLFIQLWILAIQQFHKITRREILQYNDAKLHNNILFWYYNSDKFGSVCVLACLLCTTQHRQPTSMSAGIECSPVKWSWVAVVCVCMRDGQPIISQRSAVEVARVWMGDLAIKASHQFRIVEPIYCPAKETQPDWILKVKTGNVLEKNFNILFFFFWASGASELCHCL